MRGYDLYFLVVAKLLNNKYLRLFNFYFHTLIQQRRNFKPEAEGGNSYFGTDSMVVQNGIVTYQTIASLLYEKYLVV